MGWRALFFFFFFQAEDGIRDVAVTGVQTCALPISFFAAAGAIGLALITESDHCPRLYFYRSEEPRLNSSHGYISYAVFCLKKKKRSTAISPKRSQLRRSNCATPARSASGCLFTALS